MKAVCVTIWSQGSKDLVKLLEKDTIRYVLYCSVSDREMYVMYILCSTFTNQILARNNDGHIVLY